MISSAYKPAELKAPEAPKAPQKSNDVRSSKAPQASKQEFKKSLAEASDAAEPKVKPVEVSSDKALRKPSSLINEEVEAGHPENVTPKVFDKALTEDVQKLIDPTTAEVDAEGVSAEEILKKLTGMKTVELADGAQMAEVAEALPADVKLPQLQADQLAKMEGRSPAIDFAQSEVDPQLMNLEDFVAQKNMAGKKAQSGREAYGMKAPNAQAVAAENNLKSTEVVKDISMLENTGSGTGSSSMNSQQFILNNMAEQGPLKLNETQAPMKTFDMSQVKTADADKIMNQITDYIVQAKAAKEPTVNFRMNHDQLGMIDITVMKSGMVNSDAVAINIGAHTADGKNFFQQNSKDLFSHLASAGVNVTDMKVETSSNSAKSDFDSNQQNQKHASSGERQFGSESNQRRQEQEKRADLWKMFNKEAA